MNEEYQRQLDQERADRQREAAQQQKQAEKMQAEKSITDMGKFAGAKALEASGVPPGVSNLAVNAAAMDPRVKMAAKAAASVPLVRNQINRANNQINMLNHLQKTNPAALGMQGGGGSPDAGSELKKAGAAVADPKKAALDGAKNKANGDSTKGEADKSMAEKDAEDKAKSEQSGAFRIDISRVLMLKVGLVFAGIGLIMMVFISMLSLIASETGAAIVMGEMVSGDKELINDVIGIIGNDGIPTGQGPTAMSPDTNDPLFEYYKRFEVLGNVFSSRFDCKDVDCVVSREEYRYYLKVADIAIRYKNKYNINLDWILLNATIMFNEVPQEEIMGNNMHDYDLDAVEDFDRLMDLDWDYDYKNISGYQYLDADDSRYDLQLLAKHMVRKTTTQTCTRTVRDGDSVRVEVVAEQVDEDVEDQYLQPGKEKYLNCPSGTTYSINSNYVLDEEKYDEFLLEFLENKFYLHGSGKQGYEQSTQTGEYIFPLPNPDSNCLTSKYGLRRHPIFGDLRMHNGIDLRGTTGTPIYAVADGVVTISKLSDSYGNYIKIDHGNGVESLYAHGSKRLVEVGDQVSQGDVIMLNGSTGWSTGPHLHFEMRVDGKTQDPLDFLTGVKSC